METKRGLIEKAKSDIRPQLTKSKQTQTHTHTHLKKIYAKFIYYTIVDENKKYDISL